MTTETVTIDASIIVPYAHAAFAAGYAMYGPLPVTGISQKVCEHTLEFATENIHDVNILRFAEAKGSQQGLFDTLYQRRDRLWMKYDKASKRWVRQFAADVDKAKILDVVRRFSPMTGSESQRKDIKQGILKILIASLKNYPDLETRGKTLAVAAMAEGAAEGQTAATAMIQHLVGKRLPDLNELKKAYLEHKSSQARHWENGDLVVQAQMSGLAGDLAPKLLTMASSGDSDMAIERAIEDTINEAKGSSFYLDGAVHGTYAQAQLQTYERSGSKVDFVTVGDDRVCAVCIGIEDKNPWAVDDVPMPPVHGACRCWIAPAGTIS